MAQNGNTMPNILNKRLIILSLLDTFISKCMHILLFNFSQVKVKNNRLYSL